MALNSPPTTDVGTWALLNALIRALNRKGLVSPDMAAEMNLTLDELRASYEQAGDPAGAEEISEVSRLLGVMLREG